MKKPTWRTKWLVALLTAGCALLPTAPAQVGDDATKTNVTAAAERVNTNELSQAATNDVASLEADATEKDKQRSGVHREAIVVFGRDVELRADESAEAVVVIGGSATVRGRVRAAVVAIGGDVIVEGEVDEAAVAVMGNVRVGQGGSVKGDVVSVGGRVEIAEGASVSGDVQEVDFSGIPFLGQLDGLKEWFVQCVMKFRLLAPQVGWVWAVATGFFLFYLLITVGLPRPVAACVEEMTRRPVTTFLMGLLTLLLVPLVLLLVLLLLTATGIGLLVVPFILAALLLGALLGKAAFLQYLGNQIVRTVGSAPAQKPLVPFLLGASLITLLYLVPVLSLLIFAATGLWGIGAVVLATFGGLRREMPERPIPAAPASSPGATIPPMGVPAGAMPLSSSSVAGVETAGGAAATSANSPMSEHAIPPVAPTGIQPGALQVLTLPRAGFWERMGAAFLDLVLVGILSVFVGGLPLGFLVALAYFAGMWTWRGTTVGGIVLNLRVVRYDGQPVSFPVALVRALAAAFSIFVLFLGFLWIAWSRDKQGWHDKIAGTVVVRQPRETPLICL